MLYLEGGGGFKSIDRCKQCMVERIDREVPCVNVIPLYDCFFYSFILNFGSLRRLSLPQFGDFG